MRISVTVQKGNLFRCHLKGEKIHSSRSSTSEADFDIVHSPDNNPSFLHFSTSSCTMWPSSHWASNISQKVAILPHHDAKSTLDRFIAVQGFSREPRVFKSIYLNRVVNTGTVRSFSRIAPEQCEIWCSSEAKSSTAKQDYERVVCCAGGWASGSCKAVGSWRH